jgi:hypothetical protein
VFGEAPNTAPEAGALPGKGKNEAARIFTRGWTQTGIVMKKTQRHKQESKFSLIFFWPSPARVCFYFP